MKISRVLCVLFGLILCMSAQASTSFTNKEYMKLTAGQQHWWLAGAIEGVGHLVYLNDEAKAQCVWRWYANNPDAKKMQFLESVKKYPDHAPTTILLGLLQKECGALTMSKK